MRLADYKFRVYVAGGGMLNVKSVNFVTGTVEVSDITAGAFRLKNKDLLQVSDFQDFNGTFIAEADILRSRKSKNLYVVECPNFAEFQLVDYATGEKVDIVNFRYYEVVGNTYQNKNIFDDYEFE